MPRIPMIFGISMASRTRRRWLVLFCHAVLWALILLVFSSIAGTSRYILTIAMTFVGSSIQFVIFYKLAGDTVLPLQIVAEPHSLGLLRNPPSDKFKLDERQVAVRNSAYHKAYRIVAAYLLMIPIIFLTSTGSPKMFLAIYTLTVYGVIYTLPQAIILWTEPDLPGEAS
jgi:hypothetical protein